MAIIIPATGTVCQVNFALRSPVTFDQLEDSLERTIEKNRKRQTLSPCPREALFAHAFFHVRDDSAPVAGVGLVPTNLPFEHLWLVTNYKGLAIVAYVERMEGFGVRPDYLWYPTTIPGHLVRTTEQEMDTKVSFIIDEALFQVLTNDLEEAVSPTRARMNHGLAKVKNPPTTDLPAFIRVLSSTSSNKDHQGGTHASPVPHDRKGHWRYYKVSGKRVWINDTKVLGGSPVPRNYRVSV